MPAYQGKDLQDSQARISYKMAEAFTDDLSTTTPDVTGKEALNDHLVFLLEHYRILYDLIVGGTLSNPGILLMPQEITEDLVVPAGFNGLTITDSVAEGIEIEVADGSKLYHIDETELAALLNVVKVSTSVSIKDVAAPYTASKLDTSFTLRFTAAGNLTIPDVADQGWVVGETITITNRSGGVVALVASGSTTFSTADLNIPDGGAVTLLMDSADNWLVIGATTA